MSLDPLLSAPFAIRIHAFAAFGAFALGLVQFVRPKGTFSHRTFGWTWLALMAVVALSSFWISEIRQFGPYSLIHLLSIYTLGALPVAVLHARRGRVTKHRRSMIAIFIGALVIAGIFTLAPGRIMHRVLFGG